MNELVLFCRWAIGITFAVSAAGKATAMDAFRISLHDFGVRSEQFASRLALAVVGSEVGVAALLAISVTAAGIGFGLGILLLVGFSGGLVRALRGGSSVRCNCFGRSERPITWYDVVRNILLALCCLAGVIGVVHGISGMRISVGMAIVLAFMGAVFTTLVTNLGDIVEVLRRPHVLE